MALVPQNGFHGVHGMNVPVSADKVSNPESDGKCGHLNVDDTWTIVIRHLDDIFLDQNHIK